MWLLSSRVVLSYSLFAVCHANETHRIKPRGTGTGVNPFPPTYSPIPSPTEAPSAMMTEPPAPEVDDPTTSPAPFILTPDEFHSSALEPTAIAECLAQASEQTGLPVLGFLVTLPLILSDSVVAFLVRLRKFLQTFIATDMLGCGLSRRADTRMIRNVQLDVSVYNATFASNNSCTNCTEIGIYLDIYYDGWDTARIGEYLFETLASRCSSIASLAGVDEISDACRFMTILGPDGTVKFLGNILSNPPAADSESNQDSGVNTTNANGAGTEGDLIAQEDSISTLGVMALSFSALTIVFGVLVATKCRKRVHGEVTDDEKGDETFQNDYEAGSNGSGSSPDCSFVPKDDHTTHISDLALSDVASDIGVRMGSQTRFVSVVEESDAVASNWSGVSSKQRGLPSNMYRGSTALSGSTQYAQKYASTLSQACVPASTGRSYHGLPIQPVRAYGSPDTVQL